MVLAALRPKVWELYALMFQMLRGTPGITAVLESMHQPHSIPSCRVAPFASTLGVTGQAGLGVSVCLPGNPLCHLCTGAPQVDYIARLMLIKEKEASVII